jgi:hypothetical protein
VAIGLAGPPLRADDEQGQATLAPITVVVIDFAGIAPEILDRATVEAARTYRRMGVRTVWLHSVQGSTDPTPGSEFTIKLIIQPRLASGTHGSRSVLAAAPPSQNEREGSIYVFYDRVTEVAAMHGADPAFLMGIVIAHEMGHRLLHHADHAPEGLMRGVWDAGAIQQGAMGLLWFSPSELQEIRRTLSTSCPSDRERFISSCGSSRRR